MLTDQDERAEEKQHLLDVARLLKGALSLPAVAQNRELVDVIEQALETLEGFDSLAAEAKAEVLASEGYGVPYLPPPPPSFSAGRWQTVTPSKNFRKPGRSTLLLDRDQPRDTKLRRFVESLR